MKRLTTGIMALGCAVLLLTGAAAASSDLWLHVKVAEGEGGAKVTVNLPISLVAKAVPMLPEHHLHEAHLAMGDADIELADLRELWQEIKNSPDMTFVTVEEDDETVRVWKKEGWVHVEVRDQSAEEEVDVKMPTAVVDALLAGEEIDIESAVRALVEHGQGEFVTVRDRDDKVRVWVDDVPEAE